MFSTKLFVSCGLCWCILRTYLLMSRGVMWGRRDVMTSEMTLTVWTVMPGSESLKMSFGNRPIPCRTLAFLLSLVQKQKGKQSIYNNNLEINNWQIFSNCLLL